MTGGLTDVPQGLVGTVVTFLEMTERPAANIPPSPLFLEHWREAEPAEYRSLFRRVGGPWLWFSRLAMDDPTLRAAMGEVHRVIDAGGDAVGLVELSFARPGETLIQFLGLVPELAGQGHGRWLIAAALVLAWRPGTERVVLHTCSLDHPAALPAYLRAGFRPVRRAFESFPDPRLSGLLGREVAPQIPLIEPKP